MKKYIKSYDFVTELQSEILTQHIFIDYIESTIFEKLQKVKKTLDIDFEEDSLYSHNQESILFLTESIDTKVKELESTSLVLFELPNSIKEIDQRSYFGELINGICELLLEYDNESDENILKIIKNNIEDSHKHVDPIHQISFTNDQILSSFEAAKIINNNRKYYEKFEIIDTLLNFKATLRLIDNSSFSNIYRQSFINIFSIFEASIFDVLKDYFKKNIGELERFFNPNNSNNNKLRYSSEDLLDFETIDSLHDDLIERRFSGIYLSTIIRLLKCYNSKFFDDTSDLTKLFESINRRNIHIHNKGIVDSKYILDANPYSFKLGDTAFISRDYLYTIFKLFTSFDNKITKFHK